MRRLLSWIMALLMLAGLFAVAVVVQREGLGSQDDICDAPLPKRGVSFEGQVRYVGDGDSLCVRTEAGLVEVRLADFNAPEMNQSGGTAARDTLRGLVEGRHVACVAGRRTWDRVASTCTMDGVSLGELMRRADVTEGGN